MAISVGTRYLSLMRRLRALRTTVSTLDAAITAGSTAPRLQVLDLMTNCTDAQIAIETTRLTTGIGNYVEVDSGLAASTVNGLFAMAETELVALASEIEAAFPKTGAQPLVYDIVGGKHVMQNFTAAQLTTLQSTMTDLVAALDALPIDA